MCGAPLKGTKESTPSRQQRRSYGVHICPHCAAIYSYRQAPISQEDPEILASYLTSSNTITLTCQNCARLFHPQ
jgi:RNase P subunit RPR2